MKDKKAILKISEIVFDETLYPREGYDWKIGVKYSDAMKAKAVFPPIKVALVDGKYVLIDGKHRIEAKKLLKERHIDAIVMKGLNRKQMLIEAIESNVSHGKPLSLKERITAMQKLTILRVDLKEMSDILRIPIKRLETYTNRDIKQISPIPPTARPTYNGISQEKLDFYGKHKLITDFLSMLENKNYPKDDDFKIKLKKIKEIIDGILNE